jgi:hypothetical protein
LYNNHVRAPLNLSPLNLIAFSAIFTSLNMDVFQSVYIPKQTPREAYGLDSMRAKIASYPPLGQVTLVEGATTAFMIRLETDKSRATDAWEVSLWHSNGCEWQESQLKLVKDTAADLPTVIQTSNEITSHHLYFAATVDVVSPMNFTIRFRTASDQPWKWVKDQQGTLDGIILSKSMIQISRTEDLHDLIKDLNPVIVARKVLSQSPDTSVWSVTAPVEAAVGEKSTIVDVKFGLPWAGEILRYDHLSIFCQDSYIQASISFHEKQDFAYENTPRGASIQI